MVIETQGECDDANVQISDWGTVDQRCLKETFTSYLIKKYHYSKRGNWEKFKQHESQETQRERMERKIKFSSIER